MRIDFFEEFPTDENLAKAALVDFPSTVYITSRSHSEYERHAAKLRTLNSKLEPAYWPVLERSYWISPFSHPDELEKLGSELSHMDRGGTVLLDLELPFVRKKLFLENARYFAANKRKIQSLILDASAAGLKVVTAEYPLPGDFLQRVLRILGVAYDPNAFPHEACAMMYTSMIRGRFTARIVREHVARQAKADGRFHIGLGTIASGILGNEPILHHKTLGRDLEFAQASNAASVIVFRLGGLNDNYMKALRKYATL